MRKSLAATIAVLALVFGLAPASSAAWDPRPPTFPNDAATQAGQPDLPACADPANMPVVASTWAEFETACGATVTPELREFTNLLEVLVGHYSREWLRATLVTNDQLRAIARQDARIERKREKIQRQRETIERLRSRL